MSAGLDIFSAVATVISTMDIVIRTTKELYDARARQIDLPKVLETHHKELESIKQVLKIVQQEKALQVPDMYEDLCQLQTLGMRLSNYLLALRREKGQIKQYTNQILNGKKIQSDLADIMANMSRVKANLGVKIQVVHVGLTRSVGNIVVVNCELVEELDQKLQKLLGQGHGLKLAGLLQHKKRHEDGTIHLKDSDIASLSDSDTSSVTEVEDLSKSTSRVVDNNKATDDAFQLNGPIGIGGFVEVDHLVITNNTALKKAIQVNHAVSQNNFDKLLAARLSTI